MSYRSRRCPPPYDCGGGAKIELRPHARDRNQHALERGAENHALSGVGEKSRSQVDQRETHRRNPAPKVSTGDTMGDFVDRR